MKNINIKTKSRFLSTDRKDFWWKEPLWTGFGFLVFVLYTTWAMLQGNYYWWSAFQDGFGGYLSPFYSPLFFINEGVDGVAPLGHAWFGAWPEWIPRFVPATPAILILAGPLSFRMTCYYYRKFYYRAYFLTPPGCAVSGFPYKKYKGETVLFVFQNLHRYTLYLALIIIAILAYDGFLSLFRGGRFGVGVGSLILIINPILLSGYTFGCHAFRHLVGGNKNCFTCIKGKPTVRYRLWKGVSVLNNRHMFWAWASMVWVAFSDIYVRMVASGAWTDLNTWGS